jgi:glycine oxidase
MGAMKVLIVGGGVVGLSTACALAEAGHAVQVLERERTGSRASWVAAGLLTPSSPWRYPPALIDLCHRSEALYPGFVASLQRHTGVDSQLETRGMLYPVGVGFGAAAIEESRVRRVALGFDVRPLDRPALDALQPGLGETVTDAAWQPVSSRVRPPRLLAALRARALQLDVSLVEHCAVSSLQRSGGAVSGVRTESGQELGADVTVLAAGAWSGLLSATAGLDLAVRPVRGQILLLKGPAGLLAPVINDGDCYLVPRRDGRILVGSTMEDAGFDAVTTPAALTRLRELAATLLPATAELPVETDWAGLRPGTLDRMPYVGAVPELPGLVLATGHFRNGILLAPITAALVADVIEGREPAVDLAPFACREVDPSAAIVPAASP